MNSYLPFTLLPTPLPLFGKITQARLLKLLHGYLGLITLSLGLVFGTNFTAVQVFGLGLVFPGAGFLAYPDISFHLVALSVLLFASALIIWFGTGNILAPPLTWFIVTVWAATVHQGAISTERIISVYSSAVVIAALIACILTRRFHKAKQQRHRDNAYLLAQQPKLNEIFSAKQPIDAAEMSLSDLQRLRFALDRALQPVNEFNGFEWLDQFQTAAVRYQLNLLGYALAMTQARFTPACASYLHEAQIRLIDKQTDYRIWSYWGLENQWGNVQRNPNPLCRENIMYTGFVALQMALCEASSGRNDFKQAGRFNLQHPAGQNYAYHDAALLACLEKEYQTCAFFLIACEPNWIYPLCNTIGASAILAYDSLREQHTWVRYQQPFRQALETEFLDAFGHYIPCRSARTGIAFPSIGGIMPLAMPCFFLNAIAPDLAVRQWLLLRRQLFDKQNNFQHKAFWRIDTGNYGLSRASAYTATALAAAELGDTEVYTHCLQALEQECPRVLQAGVIHRQHSSVWAHGVEIMACAIRKNSFRDLILHPQQSTKIRLDNLNYPAVLVASAHSDNNHLTAVLYAGNQEGIHEISCTGLKPQQRYRLNGALASEIVADFKGTVLFKIRLQGRTVLTLYPAV